MTEPAPPAGWYTDPEHPNQHRYWDGTSWTTHVQEVPVVPSPVPGSPDVARRKRRGLVIGLSAGAVVLLALVTAVFWGANRLSTSLLPEGSSILGSGGKVLLSEADFYQRELKNLREMLPEDDGPVDPLAAPPSAYSLRSSPGYRTAVRDYLDELIAEVEEEGSTEFGTLDDAEAYAFDTLGENILDQTSGLFRGSAGTELASEGFPQDAAIIDIEGQIAGATITPDADGSYLGTADRLAALVGSEITLDVEEAGCSGSAEEVSAFVCLGGDYAGWGLITVTPDGMERAAEPGFVDTVKHEIAHKLMAVQCSSDVLLTDWHSEYGEGVTNSYAVLYLGADRAELARTGDTHPEYIMNDTTDEKARALHDSDLACFDYNTPPEL